MPDSITDNRVQVICVIGFLLLPIGVVIAYLNPATAYELTIYAGTPIVVWVLLGLAMAIGLFGTYYANRRNLYLLSIFLIGLTAVVFVAMPILRGYYFLSTGDAPTHYGWAVDIFEGVAGADEYDHTGVQLLFGTIAEITGYRIHEMSLTGGLAFFVSFLVMIPVVLRMFSNTREYLIVGVVSGMIALPLGRMDPINFSPRIQAYMFLPVVFYLLFKPIYDRTNASQYAILFLIGSMALLTFHVEYPFYLFLVLIPVGALLFFFTTVGVEHRKYIPLYSSILASGIIAFWWANRRERVERRFASYAERIFIPDEFTESVGEVGRSETLTALGSSVLEVFLKMYIVEMIFILFTGIGALVVGHQYLKKTTNNYRIDLFYLYSIAVSGGLLFFVMLISGFLNLRYFGFLMVIISVAGSIGLFMSFNKLSEHIGTKIPRQGLYLLLILFILLSAPVVFMSPYVFTPTGHISEAQVVGHATFFSHVEDDCEILFYRSRIDRYHDMILGPNEPSLSEYRGISLEFTQPLAEHYPTSGCGYFSLTDRDIYQDIHLYKGLRFSLSDMDYLSAESAIYRISDNGDHVIYYSQTDFGN